MGSGKSSLAKQLEDKFSGTTLKTKNVLKEHYNISDDDRIKLQRCGTKMDRRTNGAWVRDALKNIMQEKKSQDMIFIVDSVYIKEQIVEIRKSYGNIIHLHLTADIPVLKKRYSANKTDKNKHYSYSTISKNNTEQQVETLSKIADVVINTEHCTENDVLVRATSHIMYEQSNIGYVDVIVGGQYGSEGKGQIAAYIANEYDLLIRVGGPNAGHKIYEEPEPYTHHQLPSGTRRSNASILLGAGMVINVVKLRREIIECDVDSSRLYIDPQAIIINEDDIKRERKLSKEIGSTKQGVGYATARKITHRFPNTKLAKDEDELKPYCKSGLDVIHKVLKNNGKILLEGTQGTGLSLHHGHYPYVTSRDTTVSGCLSESGISPSLVRRIIMVCRTYPIRVQDPKGKSSGPISSEITWEEVAKRSGINSRELKKTERTSTTNRQRKVGEFDWDLIKKASLLNGPTDIALTFTDYISASNKTAIRFKQLTTKTLEMIEEIERVTGARVSIITTGFSKRSVIDRRRWQLWK